MPPLAPPADQKAGPRQQRSASFHGRSTAEQQEQQRGDLLRQRPRTHPDLLAGVREDRRSFRRRPATHGADAAAPDTWPRRAAPSKVLVTVSVQRSMWPLHVMASAEWRVADLVAAAVGLYVREGRRPLLTSDDPSAFGLHYSQFSLQSLDPGEKVVELGSRSFFLCPKVAAASVSSSSSTCPTEATTANPADRPNMLPPWLGFMHYFWPLLQRSLKSAENTCKS
ncbi:hypothetical protein HU200_038670 [Digitaria exilis]|uniref:DUF7054 domain-containing protein n=1 Tax=Digitaria exilis TaxID=1010633 RepID=A0A835EHS1_9POAL|nr:hypothetical protein HU200_038670 [Digitaria exilis]CAB3449915.1 unnamed protein product [Digitaria exilis]